MSDPPWAIPCYRSQSNLQVIVVELSRLYARLLWQMARRLPTEPWILSFSIEAKYLQEIWHLYYFFPKYSKFHVLCTL